MRKLTQKLVLSVVTMALVVIALGTSTFAWFTLTNKASIASFNAQVTAGEGIEITLGHWNGSTYVAPVDATTWYTVMPKSVIDEYITRMYTTFSFDNVTSPDGSTMLNEELIDVSFPTYKRFLQFVIYFRSTAAKHIVWSTASLSGTDDDTWTVNVPSFRNSVDDGNWTLGQSKTVAAWTGARVSIEGSSTVVYQAEEDQQSGTIINSSIAVGDDALVPFDLQGTGPYTIGPAAYGAAAYGVAAGKTTSYPSLPTLPDTINVNTTPTQVLTINTPQTLNGTSYFTGNLVLRIWIEGFDADTFDAIFNTELSVLIGFTATNA